jgi:hypothetical protein
MPQKVGLNTTFVVLLVVAAVMVLVGWFIWMYLTPRRVPTAPGNPTSSVRIHQQRLA